MTSEPASLPPDTLNQIGVLKRREIEARILLPLIQALEAEFGPEKVRDILRRTIIQVAETQGAVLAGQGSSLEDFAATLHAWTQDSALEIEVVEKTPNRFAFNVHRCRYAEMYRALGIPELGALLSCNRDAALIQGFNPAIQFERTQTIMQGAAFCDFRYTLPPPSPEDSP